MTLAKTCHASNMMPDFIPLLQPQKLSELRCLNVPLYWEKLNLILKRKVVMLNEKI